MALLLLMRSIYHFLATAPPGAFPRGFGELCFYSLTSTMDHNFCFSPVRPSHYHLKSGFEMIIRLENKNKNIPASNPTIHTRRKTFVAPSLKSKRKLAKIKSITDLCALVI